MWWEWEGVRVGWGMGGCEGGCEGVRVGWGMGGCEGVVGNGRV